LVLYHGVRHTPSGCLYRLGVALFELENPRSVFFAGFLDLGPDAEYERHGDVDDVVFPCGYTIAADGDTVSLYYGAADCAIALARTACERFWLGSTQRQLRSQTR